MRFGLLFGLCLGLGLGCSGGRGHDPAWPKQTVKDTDGGESLAPRTATTVSASERSSDTTESKPDVGESKPAAIDKPAASDAPAPSSPSSSQPDEPVTTEDIVIEIDD